jgi:hypothetical protein
VEKGIVLCSYSLLPSPKVFCIIQLALVKVTSKATQKSKKFETHKLISAEVEGYQAALLAFCQILRKQSKNRENLKPAALPGKAQASPPTLKG